MPKNPPYPPIQLPEGAKPTKEPMKYLPQLSLKERDRRWDGIRKKMLLANIDVLVFMGNDAFWDMGLANLRYVTQIGPKGGAHALFFIDRDPIVFHSRPHMNRPTNYHMSTQDWIQDIRPMSGVPDVAAAIKEAGLTTGTVGLVSFGSAIITTPTFFHGDVLNYEKNLPGFKFTDANWVIEQMRLIKSEEEIAVLAKAGALARMAVNTMIEHAHAGVTEAGLWAEMIRTQIRNGGEPQTFNMMISGPVDHSKKELWHLLHGSEQPISPSMRPLQDGDIVVNEFHTQYGGYLAATEFSVYIGKKAPQEILNIHKVCVECLEISQEVLVPGKTLREAWEAIRRPAEKAAMDFVELGFHGHGLASPEFPTVVYRPGYGHDSMNGYRLDNLVFEENMVFGNNIDLFDPKFRVDVGCMFGDMMVVKKGGAQKLVKVPLELPQNG